MSKKCKAASKAKNLAKKRTRRAANRAKYEAFKAAGTNRKDKSKRAKRRGKIKLVKSFDHPEGPCRNIGCVKCDPFGIHKTEI